MPRYFFTGDICHPGVVYVRAASEAEARVKLDADEFEVFDEQSDCLRFDDCGEDPEVLDDLSVLEEPCPKSFFLIQYRREQRAEEFFEVDTSDEAAALANKWAANLNPTKADILDDEGELDILEIREIAEGGEEAPPSPDSNDGPPEGIQRLLDLSTAHLPCSDPEWGGLRVARHEHGFIVFVPSEAHEDAHEPGWAHAFMAYARKEDCMLVNFDAAGDVLDFLPKWEW